MRNALRPARRWMAGLLLLGCGAIAAAWVFRSSASPRMNVLLITLDTTRADRVGCYGHASARTPVLDALARHGVLFERAYAPAPLTLPSHASMLTGLYPPEHGLHNNGQAALPKGVPTLATELQAAGYETGAFIAAFVLDKKFGLARGFQTYDDDLSRSDPSLEGHHRYRAGELVIDAALEWLKPRTAKPFFCWVHLFDPHYPYLPHKDRVPAPIADDYDAEIAYVDAEIGRLIDMLGRSGIRDRTIIVIAGDHGESLGEHGERTHSMTLYDAALRVPLLASVPGINRPGHRVAEQVSLVDLCPTLLDVLKLKPIPDLSGRSLRAALLGESFSAEPCYAETDEPYHTGHWSPQRALIASPWKYVRSPNPELYDLSQDPLELRNLAESHAERLRVMEEKLTEWERRMEGRLADRVPLAESERRTLQSLGYAAGQQELPDAAQRLRDVKDMLPYYNLLDDADALMDAGRYDEAEPVLRKILEADEAFFRAQGAMGRCLLRLNRIPEAIVHLKRTVELDPGADRVRTMLGTALYLHGDYSAAEEELRTAIRLNPELPEAQHNLGLTLEKLNHPDEAIEHYRACLDLLPHFTPARQRLETLLNQ